MTEAMPASTPGGRVSAAAATDGQPVPSEAADRLVTELYERHRLALVSTALVLVGDRPTAEDVVQDAFADARRR